MAVTTRQIIASDVTGLGFTQAPSIIRGELDITKAGGAVVLGFLGTAADSAANAQRLTNGTNMQTALNTAASQGKWIGAPSGTVQHITRTVDGSVKTGLMVRGGTPGIFMNEFQVQQFDGTYPSFSLGGSADLAGQFEPPIAAFGVAPTTADGVGIRLGKVYYSRIKSLRTNIYVPVDGVTGPPRNAPWIGMDHFPGTFFFSNEITYCKTQGEKGYYRRVNADGTGDSWGTMHLGDGDVNSRYAHGDTGAFFAQGCTIGTINQLNVEWAIVGKCVYVDNVNMLRIGHLHIEGCKGSQSPQTFGHTLIGMSYSKVVVDSMTHLNGGGRSADNGTYSFNVANSYGPSSLQMGSAILKWDTNNEGTIDRPITVFSQDGGTGFRSQCSIKQLDIVTNNGAASSTALTGSILDNTNTLPLGTGQATIRNYDADTRGLSVTEMSTLYMPAGQADFNQTGSHKRPIIILDTPLTADRKVVLSNKYGTSGIGFQFLRTPNDLVEVVRTGNATGAFNLNVYQSDGTTLITSIAAGGASKKIPYSGTAWGAAV